MMKQLFRNFIVLAVVIPTSLSAFGYDFKVDGIYYQILSSEEKTVGVTYQALQNRPEIGNSKYPYSDYAGDVTIPAQVENNGITYTVTEIGDSAFFVNTGVTNITLPNSLKTIGSHAFYNCNELSSVTIVGNNLQSIEMHAFENCYALSTISFPSSITHVGEAAFGATKWLGDQPYGCVYIGKTLYDYKGEVGQRTQLEVVEGTVEIGYQVCHYKTDLTRLTLPASLKRISDYAFAGTGLTSVNIPNSVEYIGRCAFECCESLATVTHSADIDGVDETAFGSTPWAYNHSNGMWYIGTLLKQYVGEMPSDYQAVIKDGTKRIAGSAFVEQDNLTSVTLPNSLEIIGGSAFCDCHNLENVVIPQNVKEIQNLAFWNCSNLKSVSIPTSLKSVGGDAFSLCSKLENVHITDLESWLNIEFKTSEWYNSNPLVNGAHLMLNGTEVVNLIIPETIKEILPNAFYGAKHIKSIQLHSDVAKIGDGAFYGCTGLTSITLPSGLTSIGGGAFRNCSSLTDVTNYALTPQKLGDNVFSTSGTLHVRTECVDLYKQSTGWCEFSNIVGGAEDVTLIDGEAYTLTYDMEEMDVTYQRTFEEAQVGKFQALYLPFTMLYDEWSDKADIYRLKVVVEADNNDDGRVDEWQLRILKLREGESTKANTPYIIKPKQAGSLTFVSEGVTLKAAANAVVSCESLDHEFRFTGTNTATDIAADTYFGMTPTGDLAYTTSTVSMPAQRWYMAIYDKATGQLVQPSAFNPTSEVRAMSIVVEGEDEQTTLIEGVEMTDGSAPSAAQTGSRKLMLQGGKIVILSGGKKYNVNGQMIK